MVQITRTPLSLWEFTLRKRSWRLGSRLHHGWAHGWPAFVPWRFWGRSAFRNSESFRSFARFPSRRIQQEYTLLRFEVSRYLSSRDSWSKVCTSNEWHRNRPNEKDAGNGSLCKNHCQVGNRTWLLWWYQSQGPRVSRWEILVKYWCYIWKLGLRRSITLKQ